jgi:hypothetical protein
LVPAQKVERGRKKSDLGPGDNLQFSFLAFLRVGSRTPRRCRRVCRLSVTFPCMPTRRVPHFAGVCLSTSPRERIPCVSRPGPAAPPQVQPFSSSTAASRAVPFRKECEAPWQILGQHFRAELRTGNAEKKRSRKTRKRPAQLGEIEPAPPHNRFVHRRLDRMQSCVCARARISARAR